MKKNPTDIVICKSELESLAMAAYQAALGDAVEHGLMTLKEKHTLTKAAMEESIVFESKSFYDRKRRNETGE
jgi:hypothetical protein